MKQANQSGFALAEFLVGSLATMVVIGATFTIMNQLVTANRGMAEVMSTRANVRVAMNMIARDITMAGTGLPSGSVGVPNGAGATAITRPGMAGFMAPDRDLETPGNIIPIVSTGSEDGPSVAGETDVVTILTTNQESPTWRITGVEVFDDRYEVTFSSPIDAGDMALAPGDLLVFNNNYGSVLGCVSALSNTDDHVAIFDANDVMGINQPAAENGNLGSIRNPGTDPATYPPTTAMKVKLITYFLNNDDPSRPQLMRAVNGAPADLVADEVEDLQFLFDTWDEDTETQTSNVETTANPNQIRSVSVFITGRSTGSIGTQEHFRFPLVSKVNVRNSTFRNRYAGS
jgi:hypothetical protein